MSEENIDLGRRILDATIRFIDSKNQTAAYKEWLREIADVEMIFEPESKAVMFDDRRVTNDQEKAEVSSMDNIEKQYPQTTDLYKNISKEMYIIFCSKQEDYGPENITLGNDLEEPNNLNLAVLGLAIRMNDKIQRLMNLTRDGVVPNNESIEDTLVDIGNYAIMSIIVKKGVWSK